MRAIKQVSTIHDHPCEMDLIDGFGAISNKEEPNIVMNPSFNFTNPYEPDEDFIENFKGVIMDLHTRISITLLLKEYNVSD